MSKVRDIGERPLIEQVMKRLTVMPGMPLPFWDDASALPLGDGRAVIVNTDMLVWQTDIPRGMTPYQAACKAVVMNISDLAAKGVQPAAFMPNLAVPRDYPAEHVLEMAQGFEDASRRYGAYVIGGDTNEACDVVISGVALGVAETGRLMPRAGGAEPGHILATTGLFGLTSAAFKHLLEDYTLPAGIRDTVLDSVYKPEARVAEGLALAGTGSVTACMDSSDGLAVSLHDLMRSTGYGFTVTEPPVHPVAVMFAEHHSLDPVALALQGGEEYHLVFTYPPEARVKVREALAAAGSTLVEVGYVAEEKEVTLRVGGRCEPILPVGWDHFHG